MSSKTMLKIGHSLANRTKRHKFEAKVGRRDGRGMEKRVAGWLARPLCVGVIMMSAYGFVSRLFCGLRISEVFCEFVVEGGGVGDA